MSEVVHPQDIRQRPGVARVVFSFLALTLLTLTGCVTPSVRTAKEAKLADYRRVYFLKSAEDPRAVAPRVLSRLRSVGFEVHEYDPDSGPLQTQGSGFFVSSAGHLLTCAHVVTNKAEATVRLRNQNFVARVVALDTERDLALLQIKEPGTNLFSPLPMAASAQPKLGETVFTMGFPLKEILGTSPRLTKGMVSSTVGMEDNPHQLQVSAEVQSGNSGGPLFTEKGEVVGMVASTINPLNVMVRTGGTLPQNVNFAIKAPILAEFLAKNSVQTEFLKEGGFSFERIQQSIAMVEAGIAPAGQDYQPSAVCILKYISFWDVWYRFRAFELTFHDLKSGETLLQVGQYRDNPFSTEDGVMDRSFQDVQRHFFPGSVATPPPAAKPKSAKR